MRTPTLAGVLLACPAEAGRHCGIGLVEGGGGDGRVLVLHAGGAGRRVAPAAGGWAGRHALQPCAGQVVVFEYPGLSKPPSEAAGEIGGVTLLYVIVPVAPAGGR